MPKSYSEGGRRRGTGGEAAERAARDESALGDPRAPKSMRQRFSALVNLKPFLALIWEIDRLLTVSTLGLRLIRALVPVATLYFGKLIVDEVVRLASFASTSGAP